MQSHAVKWACISLKPGQAEARKPAPLTTVLTHLLQLLNDDNSRCVPCNIADAAKETVDPFLLSMCQHYAHVGQGGLVLTFIVTSAAVKKFTMFPSNNQQCRA